MPRSIPLLLFAGLALAASPAEAQGPCFLAEILALDTAHRPVAGAEVVVGRIASRPGLRAEERWPPEGSPPDSAFTVREVVGVTDANGWLGLRYLDVDRYLVVVRSPGGASGSAQFVCPSSQRTRVYVRVRDPEAGPPR